MLIQQSRGIQKGIAVHDAVADKFRMLKARNHGKDPLLPREKQVCLETNDVIEAAGGVFLPLNHRPGTVSGPRIPEAHRFERAKADGVRPRFASTSMGIQPS